MQTLEAIHSRRSIRAFTADPVSDQELKTIISAGATAPSGDNAQMWVFISIREKRRIAALRTLAPGIIGLPSAVVVMCLDHSRQREKPEGKMGVMPRYDIGTALQNILLAAHDVGLGGCAIGSFHEQAISSFLKLPENVEPCLLVVLGKPKDSPSAPRQRPIEEIHYYEKYEG